MKVKWMLLLLIFPVLGKSQSLRVIHKEDFRRLLNPDSGMFIVNAWASWCKPCIEELPLFLKADSLYASSHLAFAFVSFDFSEDSARLVKLIRVKNLPGKHYLIDETDMNALISYIDSGWSGALPATWFVSPLYFKPVYGGFSQYDDIKLEIEQLILSSDESE